MKKSILNVSPNEREEYLEIVNSEQDEDYTEEDDDDEEDEDYTDDDEDL